jgi:hypothetical protein
MAQLAKKGLNMTKQTIDITPSWKSTSEIIIMVLQNKKVSAKGLQNAFEMIREMGNNLDIANKELNKLAKEKG